MAHASNHSPVVEDARLKATDYVDIQPLPQRD